MRGSEQELGKNTGENWHSLNFSFCVIQKYSPLFSSKDANRHRAVHPLPEFRLLIINEDYFYENFLIASYWSITIKLNLRTINITLIKWHQIQIYIIKPPNTYTIYCNSHHSKSQFETNKRVLIWPSLSNIPDNFHFIRKLS